MISGTREKLVLFFWYKVSATKIYPSRRFPLHASTFSNFGRASTVYVRLFLVPRSFSLPASDSEDWSDSFSPAPRGSFVLPMLFLSPIFLPQRWSNDACRLQSCLQIYSGPQCLCQATGELYFVLKHRRHDSSGRVSILISPRRDMRFCRFKSVSHRYYDNHTEDTYYVSWPLWQILLLSQRLPAGMTGYRVLFLTAAPITRANRDTHTHHLQIVASRI